MLQELKSLLNANDRDALEEYIARIQPYDLAEMFMQLDLKDQVRLFADLPISLSAEIMEYMEPDAQYRILNRSSADAASSLLNEMSSDSVVDLLLAIHPHQAEKMMGSLPPDYREKISTLMNFAPDSAGSLATVDYISARNAWTVDQTLQHVRKVGREAEIVSYIYVLDTYGKLIGIISLKDLILAQPETLLEAIMKEDIVTVPAEMDQQEVASILSKYDLYAIPVITQDHRMIGIVTVDDLIDVIHEEATEDIQKLGGSQPLEEPYFKNSIWSLFRKRIGWLLILFVAEAYTGNVLRHYEETLNEVVALSFFIPLLIGTGGNSGTQIVTTLVRALGMGEVKFKDIFKVIRKEIFTGFFLGLCMGTVAFFRAQFLGVGFDIGTVVAITAIFIVIWSSLVAAVLPLVLNQFKVDPAVVSGPFITTLVDGTGLVIYFSMARMILHVG
ncbi:magnesium transporter [Cohnella nanjingensis]|uniref:Magnesium transporter MgtE n=1 Tax=Cohnella nanjingensis TaxID=1387779 RepID=A0A7X0RTP0_9BACL|nr:magnesium transporter [Cohnella nanjingensis]MBB6673518.1 magnesium transporter [Cohnella nanjingensis]